VDVTGMGEIDTETAREVMTRDEQIRATALLCASRTALRVMPDTIDRYHNHVISTQVLMVARKYEDYLRGQS
jgi:hypothetical protein